MKKIDVVLLSVDDWEAIYVDGESQHQGHSIDVRQALSILEGKAVKSVKTYWVDSWFEENFPHGGRLPFYLDEIPDEVLSS